MSSRGRPKKTTQNPKTPKTKAKGNGATRKQPARGAAALEGVPTRNVTDLCLEALRKINTPSSCSSPLPDSLTEEEKHEWIQTFINSITPKRVDYKKSSTKSIIKELPRNSILVPKEDPKLKMIMEKYKEPFPKIVERIDYEKTAAEARLVDERSSVMMETSDPTDEISNITPVMSFDEFLSRQVEPNCSKHNIDYNNPRPGTSKQTDEELKRSSADEESSPEFGSFVTIRKPVVERPKDVIEIEEDSDLDDSVEIVKVIPAKKRMRIPAKQNEQEIIDLDTSTGNETQQESKNFGECPICFERLGASNGITATNCGHIYCTPCIRSSLKQKKSCPQCRKHLNIKKIYKLYI